MEKIASLKNHGDIEGELNSEKIVVLARNKYLFKSLFKNTLFDCTLYLTRIRNKLLCRMQYRNGRAVVFVQLKNIWIDYPKIAALYRRSFSAICVDEAQDMNNAQYQFFIFCLFSNIIFIDELSLHISDKI
jgi:hypothetical protein